MCKGAAVMYIAHFDACTKEDDPVSPRKVQRVLNCNGKPVSDTGNSLTQHTL